MERLTDTLPLGGETMLNAAALRILARVLLTPGAPPSMRELCRPMGFTPNGAHFHVKRLKKLGLLTWDAGRNRTLRPTCRFIPASEL